MKNKKESLAITNPEISKQWHPTKNEKKPADYTSGSDKLVWWKCEKGQEWQARINDRTKERNVNCPCSRKKACPETSLENLRPDLVKEWHPTKNEKTPADYRLYSNKYVWWLCPESREHEWQAKIVIRKKNKTGCPFCSGRRAWSGNSLEKLHPDLTKEWHPTKNGDKTPSNFTPFSNKVIWWKCNKCDHEWKSVIYSRTDGNGCPNCNKGNNTSFIEQTIYYYFKKEFKDTSNRYKFRGKYEIDIFVPSLNFGIEYNSYYFHNEKKGKDSEKEKSLKKNGIIILRIEELGKRNFDCYIKNNVINIPRHPLFNELNDTIKICFDNLNKITKKKYSIKIDIKKDFYEIIELCRQNKKEKSLFCKYPILSKQWDHSKNGKLTPVDVTPGSGIIIWWLCEKKECGQSWQAAIDKRTRHKGSGCPFCSGRKVWSGNSLKYLRPDLAEQWYFLKNGELKPSEVTLCSSKMVWWKCDKCNHVWEAKIYSRTKSKAEGMGCPSCYKRNRKNTQRRTTNGK